MNQKRFRRLYREEGLQVTLHRDARLCLRVDAIS